MTAIVRIPIYQGGRVVAHSQVDAGDADVVLDRRWRLARTGYAVRSTRSGGSRGEQAMHRFILGLHADDRHVVDHINGDRLDNRRENLRIVTYRENNINRHEAKHGTPGVTRIARRGKVTYRVGFHDRERPTIIGHFRDIDDANAVARVWRADNLPGSAEAREGVDAPTRERAVAALSALDAHRARVRGVGFHKGTGTWRAWVNLRVGGKKKQVHIGHYPTREAAIAARLAWEREHPAGHNNAPADSATTSGPVPTRPETGCELTGNAYPIVHCARLGRVDFDTLDADDGATWTTCPCCGGALAYG